MSEFKTGKVSPHIGPPPQPPSKHGPVPTHPSAAPAAPLPHDRTSSLSATAVSARRHVSLENIVSEQLKNMALPKGTDLQRPEIQMAISHSAVLHDPTVAPRDRARLDREIAATQPSKNIFMKAWSGIKSYFSELKKVILDSPWGEKAFRFITQWVAPVVVTVLGFAFAGLTAGIGPLGVLAIAGLVHLIGSAVAHYRYRKSPDVELARHVQTLFNRNKTHQDLMNQPEGRDMGPAEYDLRTQQHFIAQARASYANPARRAATLTALEADISRQAKAATSAAAADEGGKDENRLPFSVREPLMQNLRSMRVEDRPRDLGASLDRIRRGTPQIQDILGRQHENVQLNAEEQMIFHGAIMPLFVRYTEQTRGLDPAGVLREILNGRQIMVRGDSGKTAALLRGNGTLPTLGRMIVSPPPAAGKAPPEHSLFQFAFNGRFATLRGTRGPFGRPAERGPLVLALTQEHQLKDDKHGKATAAGTGAEMGGGSGPADFLAHAEALAKNKANKAGGGISGAGGGKKVPPDTVSAASPGGGRDGRGGEKKGQAADVTYHDALDGHETAATTNAGSASAAAAAAGSKFPHQAGVGVGHDVDSISAFGGGKTSLSQTAAAAASSSPTKATTAAAPSKQGATHPLVTVEDAESSDDEAAVKKNAESTLAAAGAVAATAGGGTVGNAIAEALKNHPLPTAAATTARSSASDAAAAATVAGKTATAAASASTSVAAAKHAAAAPVEEPVEDDPHPMAVKISKSPAEGMRELRSAMEKQRQSKEPLDTDYLRLVLRYGSAVSAEQYQKSPEALAEQQRLSAMRHELLEDPTRMIAAWEARARRGGNDRDEVLLDVGTYFPAAMKPLISRDAITVTEAARQIKDRLANDTELAALDVVALHQYNAYGILATAPTLSDKAIGAVIIDASSTKVIAAAAKAIEAAEAEDQAPQAAAAGAPPGPGATTTASAAAGDDAVKKKSATLAAKDASVSPPTRRLKQYAENVKAQIHAARLEGEKVRSAYVMPKELREYLGKNVAGLTDEKGAPVDVDKLAAAIAVEIARGDAAGDHKEFGRRINMGQKYMFYNKAKMAELAKASKWVQRKESKLRVAEWAKAYGGESTARIPVSFWMTRTPTGVELEMIGEFLGDGANKQAFASKVLNINLQSVKHDKQLTEATVLRELPIADPARPKDGLALVRTTFTSDELKDPDLRLAGLLTHTDRKAGKLMEARDIRLGADLNIRLERGDLSAAQRLRVVADVAMTIGKLHARGLVHRDLKPENILLDERGRGHLIDLDFVTIPGQNDIAGTRGFIDVISTYALKQPSRRGMVTPLTDIYAMAQVSAETLFGTTTPASSKEVMAASDRNIVALMQRGLSALRVTPLPTTAAALILALQQHPESKTRGTDAQRMLAETVALVQCRNAIDAILSANGQLMDFIRKQPNARNFLDGRLDDAGQKAMMAAIGKQFPAYGNFLGQIIAAQKAATS